MAVLPILQLGDPRLREISAAVEPDALPGLQGFIDDLLSTMKAANGAGLAAPQVGVLKRICAVHVQDNPRYPYKPNFPLTVFVNPVITRLSEAKASVFEGCLSVPDLRGRVDRWMEVRVDALDRHGEPFSVGARGLIAGTFQHEFDHLDGLLFVDRVTDTSSFCTWANFDAHHKAAFVEEAYAISDLYRG